VRRPGRRPFAPLGPALVLSLLVGLSARAEAAGCEVRRTEKAYGEARLTIVGTPTRQVLNVVTNNSGAVISLDCNGNGSFLDPGDVNGVQENLILGIDVQLGGSDSITYALGSATGSTRTLQIALGGGTNRVELTLNDGLNSAGAGLLVDVSGGPGADTVVGTVGRVTGAGLQVRADLGAGNDAFDLAFGAAITGGAVVAVQAVLGPGSNTARVTKGLALNGSTLSIDVEGGSGVDKVTTSLASSLVGGRYSVNAELGGGNDEFRGLVDFGATSLTNAEVTFRVLGGLGNDTLAVTRGATFGGVYFPSGLVEADLKGGAGNDSLTLDLGGDALEAYGRLRLRADGGAGNDVLSLAADVKSGAVPLFDAAVTGGVGDDVIGFTLNNSGSNGPANYPVAGTILIDGSLGQDACTISGNGLTHRRGCES